MLHVYVQPVIIYQVKCNYAIFIFHVYRAYRACIDDTVHVLYNVRFWWANHQLLVETIFFTGLAIILCHK